MTDPRTPVIVQVVPELSTGGTERTAIEISQAVTMGGGEAFVISQGGRLERELESAGGSLIRMRAASKNPARIIGNAFAMAVAAQRRNASLLHARSRAPAWSARLAARRLGVPFVTTYHGVYNQRGRLKAWYNSVMASGDVVIANSDFTARTVIERHGAAPERVRVIHRGVDLARFSPEGVSDDRVRALAARWLIAPGERVVLHAARLTKWKGQTLLIDAVAALGDAPEIADVVFVLAGDAQGRTDYEHTLRERIAAHGLSGRFRLTGHCADMPAAFKLAHVAVVSPLEPEAFGRVSVEAQAMGRPVIGTQIGAVGETLSVGERRTGWLTPPADPAALAQILREVLAMPEENLSVMRRNAMQHARERFSIERMQINTLKIYDELLRSRLVDGFQARFTGERALARA
ncbi:MAG: glycosyltransferase family 4 protein [Hyphomicrobiales bacterium]|nr:glycosyltransferase family 4 protein [Hyphomicrobiales bacterium]